MNVVQFIDSRKEQWNKLENLVRDIKSGVPVSQGDFRLLTLLYRSATSDFAYAQTHYSDHDVSRYLNKLVASCHGLIYQRARVRPRDFGIWLTKTVPGMFWVNRMTFVFSLTVFLFFGLVGFFGSEYVPQGESVFLNFSLLDPQNSFDRSSDYIFSREQDIFAGEPFGIYESHDQFGMSGRIMNNNIRVAMFCFVGGLFFGLITFWSLATAGMMVGAFYHIYYRHDIHYDFWNTVMLHGMIELSMIVMAATCGFMMAGAYLYPGERKRGPMMKEKGFQSVQIAIVIGFWLVLAAFFEGYVTGARLAPWLKTILNCTSLLCLILYFGVLGWLAQPKEEAGKVSSGG